MQPSENSPYRLLVEGSDDLHSVVHLLARNGYNWENDQAVRPYIEDSGSLSKLLKIFSVALRGQYQRLGVIVDANLSFQDRWSALRDRASAEGVELPETPTPDGTIVPGRFPGSRLGFWVMPDNTSPGTLEHFLQKLVPNDDPTWPFADEAAQEARNRGGKCKEKDHLKSALHTWLAWQEDPGLPFGTALRAQVFAHDSEDALRFVAWFLRLFES